MTLFWRFVLMLFSASLLSVAVHAAKSPEETRAATRTELAAEYYRRGQYAVAIDEANKAISQYPDYALAYSMLGLIYMEVRDDEKAQYNFEKAVDLAPKTPDIRHNYGFFLCDRGQYKKGIEQYKQALLDPLYQTPDKTLIELGICSEKLGLFDDAGTYYERALRYRPANNRAKYMLSVLYMKTYRMPEARRYAMELMRQPTPSSEVIWLAVQIEKKLGNEQSAQRYEEQLRRVYPDSLETSKLLAGQYD